MAARICLWRHREGSAARGWVGRLMAVVGLLAAGCREAPKVARPPEPVQVIQVVQQDVPIYGEWIGTTVGYVTAQIRARVSGYLVSQNYKEGTLVKAGDLLFQIDARPYQIAADQARAQLLQAESQLEQAKAQVAQAEADVARAEANQKRSELDVDRYTPLAGPGSGTRQEIAHRAHRKPTAIAPEQSRRLRLAHAQACAPR